MICPHCHRTIQEQDRYLMSRDPDAMPPAWLMRAVLIILAFFAAYALNAAIHV